MKKNIITRALARSLRHPRRFAVLACATVPVLMAGTAAGASVTWDPAHNLIGSDGSGTWSAAAANWTNGVSDAGWVNGDTAIFGSGGTAGGVTVSGTVTVAGIVFNLLTGNYAISGGTIGVGSAASIVTHSDASITSALSGSSAVLTKSGTGTLTINGPSTGVSTINVTAGTLSTNASGVSAFGNSSTALVVSSGASIKVASGAVAANAMTFNGGSGDSATISGATLGGAITLASGNTAFNASSAATISGNITGSGSFTKSGTNQLTLTGLNNYTGTTTITDGSLLIDSGSSIGTGAVINSGVLRFDVASGNTLTLSNAISGTGSISKIGAGTLVMGGAYTLSGATILGGGTTLFNGTITDSSTTPTATLVVGGGSLLKGAGTIIGASTGALSLLAGGKFAPGATDGAIGTFSATSLAWFSDNTTASMYFDLSNSGGTSDFLSLTGAFTRSSGTSYIFDFQNSGMLGQTYTLISFGTAATSITNLAATNLPSGYVGIFSMTGTPNMNNTTMTNGTLQLTIVPEPGEVGAVVGVFLGLVVFLRRRNRDGKFDLLTMVKKHIGGKIGRAAAAILIAGLILPEASAKTVTIKLETATFDELQAAMNAGAITSVELATLYLNRRAVYDQAGIKINSVVSINPTLFDDAQAQDDLRSNGTLLGPLQGLVFCTKDSYPTVGMVTSGGVKSWLSSATGTFGTEAGITYGPVIAPSDCFVVQKLKAVGAVQLGHGNMDTWATSAGSTTSNAYGTTLNAYCLGSSSGSSGGPGALTGANFANFAWGGETGGSIRNPSDRAGITGFKVTVGTNSVNNIIPLASDRDVIGPMARYAKDEAYIMDASATVLDPADLWAPINYVPGRPLASGYAAKAASTSLAGKIIGVVGTYLNVDLPTPAPTPVQLSDADMEKALGTGNGHGGITFTSTSTTSNTTGKTANDAPVKAAHDRLVTELQALGATVITVFLPSNLDTAVPSAPAGSPTPPPILPATFNDGTPMPTAALNGANPAVTSISGVTATTATYASTTLALENRAFQLFHGQGVYTRLTQANAASGSLSTAVRGLSYDNAGTDFTIPAAVTHFQLKAIYNAIYEKFMDTNNLDCLIWPISFSKTRASNSVNGRDLVNNMGLPICTVPIGIYPSLGGEPITEGFLGRYRKEADVLALAAAYQKVYDHRIPSPLSPPLDGETITYTTAGSLFLQKKADKLAPVVSIKKKAKLDGAKVTINGVAADASGILSIKVFVNGRKIAVKAGKRWTAKVPLTDIKKWTKSKSKTLDVTVLAKDIYGNASATEKIVKL